MKLLPAIRILAALALVFLGPLAPAAQARQLAVGSIVDPATGARWVLLRDTAHPDAPGRWVLAYAGFRAAYRTDVRSGSRPENQSGNQSGNRPEALSTPQPAVIRAGDGIVLEEHSAIADARLAAFALTSAAKGEMLRARIAIGGHIVMARAEGKGVAELGPASPGFRESGFAQSGFAGSGFVAAGLEDLP